MGKFPEGFIWGVSSSSYQIEGDSQGRGRHVWDEYCDRPGKIKFGDSGETACDHVNRYLEDIACIQAVGARAYRFSIAWSRVLPAGIGNVSTRGVDFYRRLADTMRERGITPWATLFHWDYPLNLFHQGGWLNPDSPKWFAEYAHVVGEALKDSVSHYITLNEPQVFLGNGHVDDIHAPGTRISWADFMVALKHVLLAHGEAVKALRAVNPSFHISYAPVGICGAPETPEAIEAARSWTFGNESESRRYWIQRPYLDPVLLGTWPKEWCDTFAPGHTPPTAEELKTMHQPLDSLGLNFYGCEVIIERGEPVGYPTGHPHTAFDWAITPEGLYWTTRFHAERYQLPIVITENGLACLDWVHEDGAVHDPQRIDFTSRYLKQLHRAVEEGYDVRGYFHWSILDNFEWAEGYLRRFGLVHVDFNTQKRTVKDSGHWYRTVCDSNGEVLF